MEAIEKIEGAKRKSIDLYSMLDSQHHSLTLLNSDQYFPPVLRLKVPDIPLFSVYGLEEIVKILSQNMIG